MLKELIFIFTEMDRNIQINIGAIGYLPVGEHFENIPIASSLAARYYSINLYVATGPIDVLKITAKLILLPS